MKWYLIIFQILVVVSFFWYTTKTFGVLDSISEYFRAMREKYGRGSLKPWVFWLFLINVSWPIFALLQTGWAALCMGLIMLVGAAAEFWKGKHIEIPHIFGAAFGIAAGFFAIGMKFGGWAWDWIVPQLAISLPIMIKKVKNHTLYVEYLAIILIILAEIVHL